MGFVPPSHQKDSHVILMYPTTRHGTGRGAILSVIGMLLFISLLPGLPVQGEFPTNQYDIHPIDVTLRNDRRDGFEPHIIAGPAPGGDGEWYYYDSPSGLLSPGVSNTRRPGNVWVSKDYGYTWEFKEKTNAVVDALPDGIGGSGDTYIALSSNGALYHTDLYLSTASVDASYDGGDSWYFNPVASNYVFDDRQWLDVGKSRDGIADETMYFSFNQLFPLGLVMVKTPIYTDGPADNFLWRPCNQGLPITTDVSARDPFCVDEESGTIYITNYASGAGNLEVWKSTDGGESFTQHIVDGFSGRPAVQNIFTVIDTDMDGNIYITYSSRDHMWLAVSTDEAATWTTHKITSDDYTSVKVLPWVAGGDGGRVAMAWYESEEGTEGSPDTQAESWWDLKVAISHNATDEVPEFEILTLHEDVHYGGIQTTGTGGGSDRDLGDYLTVDIDNNGRLLVSYGMDKDDGPNARYSYPMYAGQLDGPFLRDDTGPSVNPIISTDGSDVTINLEDITDLSGFGIVSVAIDWGDGSENITIENGSSLVAKHSYSDDGTYTVQVQGTNAIGMRTTASEEIDVDDESSFEIAGISGWFCIGGSLIILVVIGIVLAARMGMIGGDGEGNATGRDPMVGGDGEDAIADIEDAEGEMDDEDSDGVGGGAGDQSDVEWETDPVSKKPDKPED
jgi:hypothetical protein